MRSRDYDVLIVTDFRHAGGTTASIAQEVEIQARMGLRTGLIQVDAAYVNAASWAERIQSIIAAGLAEVVSHQQAATARLLVLRQPRVFEHAWSLAARGDHTVMVANQLPQDGASEERYYDVATIVDRLSAELGTTPPWAPIGPTIRDALAGTGSPALELTPFDWHNVINVDAWAPRQARVRKTKRVIGRHSRDNPKKWPEIRADLLQAYPDGEEQRVRVLGGAAAARRVLGRRPRHWEVLPFGSVAPEDFLASLDLYVYFHHSGLREAFGRVVLEALASGLPVVTHPYFERLFGDVCTYCEPGAAGPIVAELLRDSGRAHNQSGIDLVRQRYDWEEHRRRLQKYLVRPLSNLPRPAARRRKVVFVSSNGGGLGHLTRLMAIARRLPPDCEPLFLTRSTGLEVVRSLGFWVDYLPSQAATGLNGGAYQEYLRSRIATALRAFRADVLVFDGTFAWNGLIQAMEDCPQVHRIWCRRGMWKPIGPDRVERSTQHAAAFDLIVEPGEFAADADGGFTTTQRDLVRLVPPIVLLDGEEILSREAAREELGIPSDSVAALLNLGAGNINRIDVIFDAVGEMLGRDSRVHLVAVQSVIANSALAAAGRISRLETYPLTRVIRAFDFCIAAPGYNSFHELLAHAVPTVFIPNEKTDIDDQVARAAWAYEQGLGLMSREDDTAQLSRVLADMLDPAIRHALRERCRALPRCDGAKQAAEMIANRTVAAPERLIARVPIVPLVRRRGPLVRYPLFLWRRIRKLGRPFRRARPRPAEPVKRAWADAIMRAGSSRVLVVANGELSGESAVQELVDWVFSTQCGVVILARADLVRPLSRLGLAVELLTDEEAQDLADRLDLASYSRQKTRVLFSTYGCGPIISWADDDLKKQWPSLFLLGG